MDKHFGHERLGFITTPTPFQEMKNLQKALNTETRIFFKRDDLTEVGLGGNKNRKLEYVMYEAYRQGADTIITWAGLQSNHCRQTLAYAVMLGMECHLVLNGAPPERAQGNCLVFDLFGAKLHYEPVEENCDSVCRELAEELKKQGKKPYYVPIGASIPLGSLGYMDCAREIAEQAKSLGVHIDHVFVGSGSGGTQAGLEIGRRLYLPDAVIDGVAVSRSRAEQAAKVGKICRGIVEYLDLNLTVRDEEIVVHDEYYGAGYAIPCQAGNDAVRLVGRTQAILLDPVYTGKAMSAVVDMIRSGALEGSEAVCFVHTGGSPAIYAFNEFF